MATYERHTTVVEHFIDTEDRCRIFVARRSLEVKKHPHFFLLGKQTITELGTKSNDFFAVFEYILHECNVPVPDLFDALGQPLDNGTPVG
jgi:hypothetical protein